MLTAEIQQLKEKLLSHVFPALTKYVSLDTAATAASLTSLFLKQRSNHSELQHLYQFWLQRNNVALVVKYLSVLFSDSYTPETLQAHLPNYQVEIIQVNTLSFHLHSSYVG